MLDRYPHWVHWKNGWGPVTPHRVVPDDGSHGLKRRSGAASGKHRGRITRPFHDGEQLALRWRDVDWAGSVLTISRAVSAGVEGPTKTGHVRRVPMADQSAAALKRLAQRTDFTAPDDYVFCNAYGRRLDGSALRRRYKHARDKAGLRPLRWHDLRHTFGALLVAGGVDLVSVQDAMGHSQLATTSRYLHVRPATGRAAIFTAAFQRAAPANATVERT